MLELRIEGYTDLNLEDDTFLNFDKISKMNKHLFQSLSDKIYRLLNFKEHIDSLVVDDTYSELMRMYREKSAFEKAFDTIKNESIPVPLGFNGNLIGISGIVNKYFRQYLDTYEKYIDTFNEDLSDFINSTNKRNQIIMSYDNRDLKKKLINMDKDIHGELMKYKSPVSTIGELFINKKGYGEVIDNLRPTLKYLDSRKMKEYMKNIRSLNLKLRAIQYMVEVEKDTVSRNALKKVVEEIELAANMSTLLGKYALVSYETVNVLKSTSKLLK